MKQSLLDFTVKDYTVKPVYDERNVLK